MRHKLGFVIIRALSENSSDIGARYDPRFSHRLHSLLTNHLPAGESSLVVGPSLVARILTKAKELTLFRAGDLPAIPGVREHLRRMASTGDLVRVGRGLYMAPEADVTEQFSAVQACKRIPDGVVCLTSALAFHGFTTQSPRKVWMAVNRNSTLPRVRDLPVRIIRLSGSSFSEGIQESVISGVSVRVYNPAKTVADCFKFRNRVGIDVAIEALRESLRLGLCSRTDIHRYAVICRVSRVMSPYMELLVP